MILPPESERDGWRAYDQVCAFESLRRRRLPWIYAGLTLVLFIMAWVGWTLGRTWVATGFLALALFFPIFSWLKWRYFRLRHAMNLHFLADLEERYGPGLPWLEVKRHLAALEKLRKEVGPGAVAPED
jgi:hypothetical protein